jgi:signal peptide peptidase SppA
MILEKYFPNKPMMLATNFVSIVQKPLEIQGFVQVHGILTKRPGYEFFETTSYEEIYADIVQNLENPGVEHVVLDIDSPGGEVSGLFDLCDFIRQAKREKSIVALANDDCLSAAYAIAASCSKVLVSRTSAVGSIGVIATHLDVSEADKKDGLRYTTIFKGARKNDLNPHEPLKNEALAALDDECERLYEMFVELVAKGRKLSVEAVKATEAGIFYGENAVKAGLADEVTTFFERKEIMEIDEEIIEKPAVLAEGQDQEADTFRSEISEIAKLCKLAKMPEKLAEFVESGVSVEEAREALMKALAGKTEDILSAVSMSQKPPESPVVAAAKARATQI